MKARASIMLLAGYAVGWIVGTFLPMAYEHKCERCAEMDRLGEIEIESVVRVPLDAPRTGVDLMPLGPTKSYGDGWHGRQFVFPEKSP